ncbi:hypothetical protein H310_14629 [Aphanomyces invadans]|uniref:Uncharacterized protein n=1 Tax=Aphanomyces invadans TaxID=157072 RepID=A0A024TAH6_9STRA|nr:hypothetical protein H310_14629 [Aphanomyces invadans]ETV90626.1 hypothetical protein H310_14629 [Aphanomyces invadans]|eukprot:XP_008880747.1 hypothetical protein H310_14629 [Aphanomyces invadans]
MAYDHDNSKLLTYEAFKGRKQPNDCHGMFNHAYFVAWFQSLLDDADALQKSSAIIVSPGVLFHEHDDGMEVMRDALELTLGSLLGKVL